MCHLLCSTKHCWNTEGGKRVCVVLACSRYRALARGMITKRSQVGSCVLQRLDIYGEWAREPEGAARNHTRHDLADGKTGTRATDVSSTLRH